ncbi:hypothetical protein GCM10027404_33560 [Arthrobacter tumbae]
MGTILIVRILMRPSELPQGVIQHLPEVATLVSGYSRSAGERITSINSRLPQIGGPNRSYPHPIIVQYYPLLLGDAIRGTEVGGSGVGKHHLTRDGIGAHEGKSFFLAVIRSGITVALAAEAQAEISPKTLTQASKDSGELLAVIPQVKMPAAAWSWQTAIPGPPPAASPTPATAASEGIASGVCLAPRRDPPCITGPICGSEMGAMV